MKKILYIHQYFKTPYEPGATRSYWIAQAMIKKGYDVTMLTSKNNLKSIYVKEKIDGINVIYFGINYDQKMNIFSRFISFLKFMIISTVYSLSLKNISLLYATSTPISVGIPALINKKLRNIPYIFEVRDLWPEVPIQMGAIKNKFLIFILKKFEKSIYQNAKHIIALSPGMKNGINNLFKSKISVFPNMSKIDLFSKKTYEKEFKNLGLNKNNFNVVYFGSIGLANDVNYIIDAAKILDYNNNIKFIFIGEGSQKSEIQKRVENLKLRNIKFFNSMKIYDLVKILPEFDISLVTFKNLPILKTNSPNKLFDSLSAGLPIIVNSGGWTKDLVEKYHCGYYVNPEDPSTLVKKIEFLSTNSEVKFKFSNNSYNLALSKYDKNIICKEIMYKIELILC